MTTTYYANFADSDDDNSDGKHLCITCDGCDMDPIVGIRYKCLVCTNYDLCSTCRREEMHPDHQMEKIVRSLYDKAGGN